MGHFKTLIFASVLLAVLSNQKTFVQGQGALQIEPSDGLSQLRRNKDAVSVVDTSSKVVPTKKHVGPMDDQTLAWRLPREVLPTVYRVGIAPVIDAGQPVAEQWYVPGLVEISVTAQRATNNIVMHSKNITIHSINVNQGASVIPMTGFVVGGAHDFLNISLGASLQQGQTYTILINFTSYITEDLNGLYRSSYVNPDTGDTVWLATTQFEALHARQMMPCFDEPALKSVFHFQIARMEKYISLFNTESTGVNTTGPAPGWVWETYAPTVEMSTYLLALIISEFTYAEAAADLFPGHRVRTYAPDHYIRDEGGVYAAANAAKILDYFSKYFENEYPLSKMDSAAVPDFYFGAMENYGLNIYRESALLVFPNWTLESERWSISSVLAHELAHQWFGDLVSPAWWTHIWLNEGFATYFAAVGSAHTNPEFESQKRFLNDAVQRSMEVAANPAVAHSVKIDEEEWITKWAMDWFDRMAYEQAGSLIRMMDGFLTTPVLTGGLKTYLNRLQYKAAQQDDLFRDLNIMAVATNRIPENLTMKDIMDTWTLKAGFPLVRVSRASSNRVYVSQEKFTLNAGAVSVPTDQENDLWHIPISIATQSSPNFEPTAEQWLDKNVAMTSWEMNAEEWIILNAGATGYYRVLYDLPLTNFIKAQLETDHTVIDPLTRSQLLDDYFTTAYQQYQSLGTALGLTNYLAKEDEIVVWNAVLKHLRTPLNLFQSTGSYANLRNYLLPKLKGAINLTGGVEAEFGERAGMPILRHQQFMDWACAMEDEECQDFAVRRVSQWMSSSDNSIPRDFHQITYCAAVAKGEDSVFQFILDRYQDTATTRIQQGYLLSALACAANQGSIGRLLEGSLNAGFFRSNGDGSATLQRLATRPVGRAAVLRFVRENATDIATHFGSAAPIASVFSSAASYSSTTADLQNLETIATEIAATVEPVKATIDAAINTVRQNIVWMSTFAGSFNG
ncbi:Aminopeptidase N [Orchesella cincta]|uniref:Aminopeptidase n=1 Tax=Orchesella cincta TaxID=48709 RepID=A0A1D2NDY5_ORCCI|nr:Aminopeptidase N [Orchesella cincta]